MQISNAALVYSIAPFYNNLFRRLAARRPVMSAAPGIEIPRGNEHFLFFLKKQNKTKKYTFSKGREIIHHSCASCVLLSLYGRGGVSTYSAVISLSLFLSFFLFQCLVAGQAISIDWSLPKIKLGEIQTFFKEETARRRRTWKYIYKYMCTDISTCHIRPVIRTPESSREGGGGEEKEILFIVHSHSLFLSYAIHFLSSEQRNVSSFSSSYLYIYIYIHFITCPASFFLLSIASKRFNFVIVWCGYEVANTFGLLKYIWLCNITIRGWPRWTRGKASPTSSLYISIKIGDIFLLFTPAVSVTKRAPKTNKVPQEAIRIFCCCCCLLTSS